jgi:hypothetical protein
VTVESWGLIRRSTVRRWSQAEPDFKFQWRHDQDAYTNGTFPGAGYHDLWECVCLDWSGVPQASRGGLRFDIIPDGPLADQIERELAAEARAWVAQDEPLKEAA